MPSRQLNVVGHEGRQVPNSFATQERPTDHLAVVLPGLGYRTGGPLLVLPAQLLTDRGADVLRVDYGYDRLPAFAAATRPGERQAIVEQEVAAAVGLALRERSYRHLTLIGKSLGATAIAAVLRSDLSLPPRVDAAWLTPVLTSAILRQAAAARPIPSLWAIGTADEYYDAALLDEVVAATNGQTLVVEGAKHSLEGADAYQTLRILEDLLRAVDRLIA